MRKDAPIYVAHDTDITGVRLLSSLQERGYSNLLNKNIHVPDVRNSVEVEEFFANYHPQYVFITAGKTGGIKANQEYPADLMLDNLKIACNLIEVSHRHSVKRLIYLASSCAYPKLATQPMKPQFLMTGSLEQTNLSYATAKLAGIELCRAYRQQYGSKFLAAMPASIFGPGDDFSEDKSHVVAGLIGKFHRAHERNRSTVEIWGSGTPRREFIFVDDLVDACIFLMSATEVGGPINIGVGVATSIAELAAQIKKTIGYRGSLEFDQSRPDGMPKKVLDSTPLFEAGWQPQYTLERGIQLTYKWYREQLSVS
jgi:GDP-L-fucose synthase